MRSTANGRALIKHFESCELEAYPDPNSQLGQACTAAKLRMRDYRKVKGYEAMSGSPWTIGWGHTGNDVCPGLVWTQSYADAVFEKDVDAFDRGVTGLVKVALQPHQFDALVSFAYNCGLDIDADTKAEGLGDSTLLRHVNALNFVAAADEFPKWISKGSSAEKGLRRRRAAERALFLGKDWREAFA